MTRERWFGVLIFAAGLVLGSVATATVSAQGYRVDVSVVGTVGQWAAATGTTFAALVALGGDWLKRQLFRVRLQVKLVETGGECVPDVGADANGRPTRTLRFKRYCHLRVSNNNRWAPIKAARLYLLRVQPIGTLWEGEAPLTWRHLKPEETRDVGPPWDSDFFVLSDGKLTFRRSDRGGEGPSFSLEQMPILVTVQARGLEADSEEETFKIEWDGSPPEQDNALRITPVGRRDNSRKSESL